MSAGIIAGLGRLGLSFGVACPAAAGPPVPAGPDLRPGRGQEWIGPSPQASAASRTASEKVGWAWQVSA
ncbi:hypothetical protein, partial [Albidovulum sp.]|uniref:hypothetical protein n=1 Tax=Albidovulum sp. TaxID=1872424 RepID=UPI002C8EF8A9|nr:hypothetical protein [Albidovulum sp.]